MLPFGTEKLTLVQRVEEAADGRRRVHYAKHVLSGCSWRRRSIWRQNGACMERSEEIVCRMPVGPVAPCPGDWLFRGALDEDIESSAELSAALVAHRSAGAFRIASVTDNATDAALLPHHAVRGESA